MLGILACPRRSLSSEVRLTRKAVYTDLESALVPMTTPVMQPVLEVVTPVVQTRNQEHEVNAPVMKMNCP